MKCGQMTEDEWQINHKARGYYWCTGLIHYDVQYIGDLNESCTISHWFQRGYHWNTGLIYPHLDHYIHIHTVHYSSQWILHQSPVPKVPILVPPPGGASPWPCQWSWRSALARHCWSCLRAPKYHSPTYVHMVVWTANKQTKTQTPVYNKWLSPSLIRFMQIQYTYYIMLMFV